MNYLAKPYDSMTPKICTLLSYFFQLLGRANFWCHMALSSNSFKKWHLVNKFYSNLQYWLNAHNLIGGFPIKIDIQNIAKLNVII